MKIKVKDSKDRLVTIDNLSEFTTVTELKKKIKDSTGFILNDNINLIFDGNILEDEDNLGKYNVSENDVLIYLANFDAGIYKLIYKLFF